MGDLWGETTAVVTAPEAVYAAVGARIRAYSLGTQPDLLGESPLIEAKVLDLEHDGSWLFAAAGPAGLLAFDASRAGQILPAGRSDFLIPGEELVEIELLASKRLAAIAREFDGGRSRLLVIDVAAPQDMPVLADLALGEDVLGIQRLGDRLVLNRGLAGLSLLEIDPGTGQPAIVGRLDRRYQVLAAAGDRLFAAFELTLHEIDWSDPAEAKVLGQPRDHARKVSALAGAPGRLCAAGSGETGIPTVWCYRLSEGEVPSWGRGYEIGQGKRRHRPRAWVGASILGIDVDAAYLADGPEGLHRIVLAPGEEGPRLLSSFEAEPRELLLHNDLAFVAASSQGLQIWDIGRPDDARRLWSTDRPRYLDLAAEGTRLYSLREGRIEIRDITDPGAPVLAGEVDLPDMREMQVDSSWIYVLQRVLGQDGLETRLAVIDAREPSAPLVVSRRSIGSEEGRIGVAGDRLWFASMTSAQLVEFDITDRASPLRIGSHVVAGHTIDLPASADRLVLLYLGIWQAQVFEIRPGEAPRPIGDPFSADYSMHADLDGDLYALTDVNEAGLRLFDISGTDRWSELGSWVPSGSRRSPRARRISLDRGRALVEFDGAEPNLHLLDLSGLPVNGAIRLDAAPWDVPMDIETSAGLTYLSSAWSGSWIVDATDRSRPMPLGSITGEWKGTPSNDFAPPQSRLATTRDGMLVVNPFAAYELSNPGRPVERYRYGVDDAEYLPVIAAQILVDGSLGFVGWNRATRSGPEGSYVFGPRMLDVVDLAGPNPPELVGRLELGDDFVDSQRSGGLLYLAGKTRLMVVDSRNPRAPELLSSTPGSYRALAALGDRLWAVSESAVDAFDTSDPSTLRRLGSLPLPAALPAHYEGRLAVSRHGLRTYGALPLGPDGLWLLDLDADTPRAIGQWRPGWPVAVASLAGRQATVGLEHGGLIHLDLDLDRGPIAASIYLPVASR